MRKTDKNKPAFPLSSAGSNHQRPFVNEGMTLRDYFAAQYITGACSITVAPEILAKNAYSVADAMLNARAER